MNRLTAEGGLTFELFQTRERIDHGDVYTKDVANVKGSALATRVSWVSLNHGQARRQRLPASRPPGLQLTGSIGIVSMRVAARFPYIVAYEHLP